jgi:hypothetical protein
MTKKSVRPTSTRRPRAAAPTAAAPSPTPANSAPETTPADVAGAGQTPAKATRAAKTAAGTAASAAPKKAPAVKTATKAAKPGAPRRVPLPGSPAIGRRLAVPPPASLRVMVVASECSPLVNSGDLGDAVATLVDGLTAAGHDVTCVVPRFSGVLAEAGAGELRTIAMGDRSETVTLFRAELRPGVRVVAIDHAGFFARPCLYGAAATTIPTTRGASRSSRWWRACWPTRPRRPSTSFMRSTGRPGWSRARGGTARTRARAASAALVFTYTPRVPGAVWQPVVAGLGLDERYASVDALEHGADQPAPRADQLRRRRDGGRPGCCHHPAGQLGFEGILAARGEALSALDLGQVPTLAGAAATALPAGAGGPRRRDADTLARGGVATRRGPRRGLWHTARPGRGGDAPAVTA